MRRLPSPPSRRPAVRLAWVLAEWASNAPAPLGAWIQSENLILRYERRVDSADQAAQEPPP